MKFGGVTRSGCGENLNVEVRDKAWLFPNGCQAAAHDHTSSIKLDRVGWEKSGILGHLVENMLMKIMKVCYVCSKMKSLSQFLGSKHGPNATATGQVFSFGVVPQVIALLGVCWDYDDMRNLSLGSTWMT